MNIRFFIFAIAFLVAGAAKAQIIKGAGIIYFDSLVNASAQLPNGSELAYSIKLKKLYRWNRTALAWEDMVPDTSQYNELQLIYVLQDTLYLTNQIGGIPLTPYKDSLFLISGPPDTLRTSTGYSIVLPDGADDWGTQVVERDSTLRGNGTAGDPLRVNRDSFPTLASVAAKLNIADTTSMLAPYAQGSGVVNFFPVWTGTRTLARSILQQPDTNHVSLGTKPLRLGTWTTAGQPATPFQGYLGYNTTNNTPTWYNGTSWVVPAQSASNTGLFTADRVPYVNANGQLETNINLRYFPTLNVLQVGGNNGTLTGTYKLVIQADNAAHFTDNYSITAGTALVSIRSQTATRQGILLDAGYNTINTTNNAGTVANTFFHYNQGSSSTSQRIIQEAVFYHQPNAGANVSAPFTFYRARNQLVSGDSTYRFSTMIAFDGYNSTWSGSNMPIVKRGIVVNAGASATRTRIWTPLNLETSVYNDSSSTGYFRVLNFTNQISQGPQQTTTPSHGIYLAPTLNSVFDYRAIETTNNVGHALYLSGTAPSRIRGWTRIGSVAATPSQALHVTGKVQVDTLTDTPASLAAFTGTTGSGVLTRATYQSVADSTVKKYMVNTIQILDTDGSGDVTVTHPYGSSSVATSVQVVGTTPYFTTVHTLGTGTFKARVYNTSGTAVTSTAVNLHIIVTKLVPEE